VKILSVDPGKNCGYAEIEFGGKVLQSGKVDFTALSDFLEGLDWDGFTAIVYEAFRVYRSHAQHFTGSVMEVSQSIGMLTAYGNLHKVRLVSQQPYHFKLGAKYMGAKLPKGHLDDELSAIYHGIAYLKSIDQFTTLLEAQRRQ
jgi:hypothetical protein